MPSLSQSGERNGSTIKAEPRLHFASAKFGHGQGATVEILDHPFSFQGNIEQGSADRATDMHSPLTPVHTGISKTENSGGDLG